MNQEFYTVKEFAETVRCKPATIWVKVKRGEIESYPPQNGRKHYLIPHGALEDYLGFSVKKQASTNEDFETIYARAMKNIKKLNQHGRKIVV